MFGVEQSAFTEKIERGKTLGKYMLIRFLFNLGNAKNFLLRDNFIFILESLLSNEGKTDRTHGRNL